MLRIAAIFLFFLIYGQILAQKDSIDVYMVGRLDTNKVILLNRLASDLREKDEKMALNYAEQARMLAERLGYSPGLAHSLENIGWIYYRKGALSNAFELSTQALKISDSLRNNVQVARILNTIAAINREQNQYEMAVKNLRRAQQISIDRADFATLAQTLDNIAYTFLAQKQLDSALHFAQEGLRLSERSEDSHIVAHALQTMGDVFLETGDVDKALFTYQQCFKEASAIEDNYLNVTTLLRFGKLYNIRQEPDLAISYLLEATKLAGRFGYDDDLESAYKVLADSYYLLGDLSNAFRFQNMYVQLHDSLFQKQNTEQLNLLQAEFEAELKQAQIELLMKDAEIKQREIQSQKVWLYFSIGCMSLMLILAFVLYDSYKRIKSINAALKFKNAEIQEQARQLSNLNITKDKLFSIISHDLRSPVASLKALMSIIGNSSLTQQEFVSLTGKLKRRLDSVYDDLDNLLQWAQSQLKGLQARPETFDLKVLVDEKIELFRESAKFKKVQLTNGIQQGSSVMADKNHISLILRNLIANAIKFTSDGGAVSVTSNRKGDQLEISVSDSGVGMGKDDLKKLFNAQTHFTKRGTHEEKGIGIGLLLTKEFVERNGGSIWVTSELGKGTTFTFTVKRDERVIDPVYILRD